ncbi:dTMP kinase [Novimethylophilus kurashikiensis]|uniref:Thymidylate kinase n=1 Tax=Novimethylophilus kurashikiensis TaxID=1825523 RepID=A0A2R5FC89_9PROT|nr:dTMP kinase [Novimethylophilus kurashikiensis]GBG14254.1 dTMP kinase [Novimethylophilus kurashikiensis]
MRKFISFEGIDGAGKSSHIPWMADLLRGAGKSVVVSREPGGTPLGERLRAMLLGEPMSIDTELLLMTAARAEHLAQVIQPALDRGDIVLCDRFHDSSYAFQGGGRGISLDRLESLDKWCGGARPDLTFLFDVPTAEAQRRMDGSRDQKDRFETEAEGFHAAVRRVYLERAAAEPGRVVVIDSTQAIDAIRAELSGHVQKLVLGE